VSASGDSGAGGADGSCGACSTEGAGESGEGGEIATGAAGGARAADEGLMRKALRHTLLALHRRQTRAVEQVRHATVQGGHNANG
jgi:hypothetical protein